MHHNKTNSVIDRLGAMLRNIRYMMAEIPSLDRERVPIEFTAELRRILERFQTVVHNAIGEYNEDHIIDKQPLWEELSKFIAFKERVASWNVTEHRIPMNGLLITIADPAAEMSEAFNLL